MEKTILSVSKRTTNIFEKYSEDYSLNDDIILKNIKLYNEQYLSERLWARKVREDKEIRRLRGEWVSIIIKSTDELEFTFDTCEIAIQFMDTFMEMKMKGEKDTSSYELFFMREDIHKWIEKKDELALFLSIIISLSGKFQELQRMSNIMIKGIDKKKMGKGEYEMMDYFQYIVPNKTPSFFMYLFVDDLYYPEKIIFYTYRIIEDHFKYSDYINIKHTLLSLSLLKFVILDIFSMGFLIKLWSYKVNRYIHSEEEKSLIEETYEKIKYIFTHSDGYIEHLHEEWIKRDEVCLVNNKIPLLKEEEVLSEPILEPRTYIYSTPKKSLRVRMTMNVGEWPLPNPPMKRPKFIENP